MIPGDIDLTENLDFRKVVKNEISKLPWKNKKSSPARFNNITYNFDTGEYSYTATTYNYSNSVTLNTTNNYSFSYQNTSTTTTNTYIQYNTNNNTIIYNVSGHCNNNENISKMPWESKKYNHGILTIPWSNRETKQIPKIAWHKSNKYLKVVKYMTESDYDFSRIPWDIKESKNEKVNLSSAKYRAKNLINWLHDKTTSFIDRYLGNESDMSYLTNMQWLRIQDARID